LKGAAEGSRRERTSPVSVTSPGQSGNLELELSEEFRRNARECLRLSREAGSLSSQAHWVSMAQFWFRLAQHVEDRDAMESVDLAVVEGEDAGDYKDKIGDQIGPVRKSN